MKSEKEILDKLLEKYNQDKKWCIEYHNKGEIQMYNLIFGRLQGIIHAYVIMGFGDELKDDFIKNVPWNRKMLAGWINNEVEYSGDDIENLNK